MTVLARVSQFLVVTNVLHGLGTTDDPTAPAELRIVTADGGRSVDEVFRDASALYDGYQITLGATKVGRIGRGSSPSYPSRPDPLTTSSAPTRSSRPLSSWCSADRLPPWDAHS
jgi:hypothetical protein